MNYNFRLRRECPVERFTIWDFVVISVERFNKIAIRKLQMNRVCFFVLLLLFFCPRFHEDKFGYVTSRDVPAERLYDRGLVDISVIKRQVQNLAINFNRKINIDETARLWQESFKHTPEQHFILAINEILKDQNIKRFPTIAILRRKLQEIPQFIRDETHACNDCDNEGLITVHVFNYNFTFVCTCSTRKYPGVVTFKCNTCSFYTEQRDNEVVRKRICTVNESLIKPVLVKTGMEGRLSKPLTDTSRGQIKPNPCAWIIEKFKVGQPSR